MRSQRHCLLIMTSIRNLLMKRPLRHYWKSLAKSPQSHFQQKRHPLKSFQIGNQPSIPHRWMLCVFKTKLDSFEGHFGKLTEVCFVNNILLKYFSKFLRSLYYVPRYPKTSRQTTNHFFTEFLPWRPLLLNISKTTLLLVYSRVYFFLI